MKEIKNLTKNFLKVEYLNKKKSSILIARETGCSYSAVLSHLRKHEIPVRSISEANKGSINRTKYKKKIISRGYIYIRCPEHPNKTTGKYVLEHRLVLEKSLKRYLHQDEIVHHINGNRQDNRLRNLAIVTHNTHERHTLLKIAQKRIRKLEMELKKVKQNENMV